MGRKWRQRYYGFGKGSSGSRYRERHAVDSVTEASEDQDGEEEEQEIYLQSSACQRRLRQLSGCWSDQSQSSYFLERGEHDTIDVTTTRPSGQVIKSKALIRIEWWEDYGRIVWGRGGGRSVYVLDEFSGDTITWSRTGSKSFQWTREDGEEEDDDDEDYWEEGDEEEPEEEEDTEEEPETALGDGRTDEFMAKDKGRRGKGKSPVESSSARNGKNDAHKEAARWTKQRRAQARSEARQKRRELEAERKREAKEKQNAKPGRFIPIGTSALRVDPEDGKATTLPELQKRYANMYSEREILQYWRTECTPCSSANDKAEHGGDAKTASDIKSSSTAKTANDVQNGGKAKVANNEEPVQEGCQAVSANTEAPPDTLGTGGRDGQNSDVVVARSTPPSEDQNPAEGINTPEPEQNHPQAIDLEYAAKIENQDSPPVCRTPEPEPEFEYPPSLPSHNPADGIRTPEPEHNQPHAIDPEYVANLEAQVRAYQQRCGPAMQLPPIVNSQPVTTVGQHHCWQPCTPWTGRTASWENGVQEVGRTLENILSEGYLAKDAYLRSMMMPTTGWVSLQILQSCPRIRTLNADVAIMQKAVSQSETLEMDPSNTYVRSRVKSSPQVWARAMENA